MRAGASAPDLTLEVYPSGTGKGRGADAGRAARGLRDALADHDPDASGTTLWGGGATANHVYRVFEGGIDDDGRRAIDAYWTSRAFEANQDALWHLSACAEGSRPGRDAGGDGGLVTAAGLRPTR